MITTHTLACCVPTLGTLPAGTVLFACRRPVGRHAHTQATTLDVSAHKTLGALASAER